MKESVLNLREKHYIIVFSYFKLPATTLMTISICDN